MMMTRESTRLSRTFCLWRIALWRGVSGLAHDPNFHTSDQSLRPHPVKSPRDALLLVPGGTVPCMMWVCMPR
eukprot:g15076.t1